MTPDYVALLRESALRDEVFPKDMVALCDEVERGWAGMRQLLADRDAARHVLAEIGRYANDPEFSDAFVRGFVQEATK